MVKALLCSTIITKLNTNVIHTPITLLLYLYSQAKKYIYLLEHNYEYNLHGFASSDHIHGLAYFKSQCFRIEIVAILNFKKSLAKTQS